MFKQSKRWMLLLVQIALLCASPLAAAEELIMAGFAFAGEAKGAATRYPYSHKLLAPNAPDGINKQIFSRSRNVVGGELPLAPPEKTINLKSYNEGLVTVLLLTGETVLSESYGDYSRTYINLRADALIFDYKNKSIVRSYPLSVNLFDAASGNTIPSEQAIQGLIRDMIFRPDDKGLISQYLNRISKATLPKEGSKSIQVAKVDVAPDAYGMFPAKLRNNKNTIDDIISDSFSSALSSQTGVSILPSKFGHALGVMTFKLSNSDDLIKLKIGDGDYLVNLKLNKYIKIKKEQTAVEVANVFGVSANVGIYEQLSNEYFINSDFKNGEVSISPLNKVAGDDFPGYSDSLTGLFTKLAKAIQSEDMDWVKSAAASPNIVKEIQKTHNILKSN